MARISALCMAAALSILFVPVHAGDEASRCREGTDGPCDPPVHVTEDPGPNWGTSVDASFQQTPSPQPMGAAILGSLSNVRDASLEVIRFITRWRLPASPTVERPLGPSVN